MPTSFRFANRPLESGLYEPEGIYLSAPFAGAATVLQEWGANPHFHRQFSYNGTPIKGHPGVDFALEMGTALLAVDEGRVMEISIEPGGFERYVKLEHRWGESFYAYLDDIQVESGQRIGRGELIAHSAGVVVTGKPVLPHLHFAIRIVPYNRFDGWGGFSNPLPFMDPAALQEDDEMEEQELSQPPIMLVETEKKRRP